MAKWKKVNPGYNPILFKVLQDIMKHQKFAYTKKKIEEEININGVGTYKVVCKWYDEEVSSYNVYKKIEEDLREPVQMESTPHGRR